MRQPCFVTAGVAALLLTMSMAAAAAMPVVYEDNNVTVRAGLHEFGLRPLHIGDALSLVIAVEFDGRAVQVENLDDAWFERTFADVAAIRRRATAASTTTSLSDGRVRVATRWQLQFLDCPDMTPSCAGSKSYTLPVAALAYRLTGQGDAAPDSRSARFRPWPGTVVLGSALPIVPVAQVEFADVFPAGAYANPQPVEPPGKTAPLLLLAGAVLLAASFVSRRRPDRSEPFPARPQRERRRWEAAMAALGSGRLDDDEWSDLLRRTLTWYCLDELGTNPLYWLTSATGERNTSRDAEAARTLFLEVLQHERIATDRRSGYLDKLEQLTHSKLAAAGEMT